MSPFLFWIFAGLMLVFGAGVVLNRNPVASALSLVVSFLGLAALFMSLDAYFIGIIQVLVYAGAVMVLFLFIIMLLDLRAEKIRKINWLVGRRHRGCARAFCPNPLRDRQLPIFPAAFSTISEIDHRRRPPCRLAFIRELQSAVSNHRCPRLGRDHRRGRVEQTRIAIT